MTRLEAGERALLTGRAEDGHELLVAARAAFSELNATPWIDRVDAASRGQTVEPESVRSAV